RTRSIMTALRRNDAFHEDEGYALVREQIEQNRPRRKRKRRNYDPFGRRPGDDKKTVLLLPDDVQRLQLTRVASTVSVLRRRLVDYRTQHRTRFGRYPGMSELLAQLKAWGDWPELKELPQGAANATT